MSSITSKIAIPVILAGLFAVIIFLAIDYERMGLSTYIVLALLIICIFFFGFATGQSIAQPVRKLLQRANDLSKGNLTTRVYLETKDEFGDLARAFNKIAEDLEESHCESQNAEKSVDIKVRAKTQALEEVIGALEQKIKNRTIELEKLMKESEKLQQEAKSKELETETLKKEFENLKKRVGKGKSSKQYKSF